MEIKNRSELLNLPSASPHIKARHLLLDLFQTGLEKINPFQIVKERLNYIIDLEILQIGDYSFNLKDRTIWVIGAGKAVGLMALAIEELIEKKTLSGLICVPEGVKKDLPLQKITCLESTHPLPSQVNVQNTNRLLQLIKNIKKEDLVISLISGGGSSLWSAPIDPISINELNELNLTLIRSGMSIHEINIIRKHVSRIKGGKLAKIIPSEIINLVISDVIGDNFDTIASGPFSPDPSTFNSVIEILKNYNLEINSLPSNVAQIIVEGINGSIPDTLKPNDEVFKRVYNFLLCSNMTARKAIYKKARDLGIKAIDSEKLLDGDARLVGIDYARQSLALLQDKALRRQSILYIGGGEPIVSVQGQGIGGRNQELIGSFLGEITKIDRSLDVVLLSAGTDGIDGNSEFAGAICDDYTRISLKEKELDIAKFQQDNDMSSFFQLLGNSLILSGPTGTNVMDIHLLLINASKLNYKSKYWH